MNCFFGVMKLLVKYYRAQTSINFFLSPLNCCPFNAFQIPLARYLPTWRGNVIDADLEMNPSRVLGMSLSVNADGGVPGAKTGPGDFRVEIDWIKALRSV